jgi:hypothetical protein
MAKKVKYKVGDVFLIPLENGRYGVGRILINYMAVVFIEMYSITPINDVLEFDFKEALKEKPISKRWCYDTFLKKGIWTIIDNKPVEGDIDIPYFVSRNDENKPYIKKGTSEPLQTTGERIYIQEEDIHNYDSGGIGDGYAEQNVYLFKLRREGLI